MDPRSDKYLTRVGTILDDLRTAGSKAGEQFFKATWSEDPYDSMDNAAWYIEMAYLKLLAAIETLSLGALKDLVLRDIEHASEKPNGWEEQARDPDGEEYSPLLARYRQYIGAIETLGGPEQAHTITKDLGEILRATEYPITDPKLFGHVPHSEDDVHRRIEGILRCVFPDLKHKPSLSKPLKNFEPDTGLPGIRTLIEYKYLARAQNAASIADQVLADTRGYSSTEWDTFVYVIYETHRFRPESEWNMLLRECDVPANTSVIVLSGEPSDSPIARAGRSRKKQRRTPPGA